MLPNRWTGGSDLPDISRLFCSGEKAGSNPRLTISSSHLVLQTVFFFTPEGIGAGVLLFARIGLKQAWEKGFVHVLWHERFHVFRGLRCGEAFEEEFQVGLGLDLVGLGGFRQ